MIRNRREVEIFSISALDLFASAMGAFVLLSVMMLPYFFKGKAYEDEMGHLEHALAESAAAAEAARTALAAMERRVDEIEETPGVDLPAERKAVIDEENRQKDLSGRVQALKKRIESERKELAKRSASEEKKKDKVTFRFLGLKTDASRYLILVDGAARIKQRASNLPTILEDIVSVFGPSKRYAIGFYNYSDNRLVYERWPDRGFVAGGRKTFNDALSFIRAQHGRMRGGSATSDALEQALTEDADSIILVSDGVVFPKHNRGKSWQRVVEDISGRNTSRIEINTVAIGFFYRHPAFWSFLNDLRRRNGGDLKAIPP